MQLVRSLKQSPSHKKIKKRVLKCFLTPSNVLLFLSLLIVHITHRGTTFLFFFLQVRKNLFKKTARCKIAPAEQKNKNDKKATTKKTLITQKKRAKEKRNRVTRCESPSPSPIKKGTRKESKQLVFKSIQILKHLPIAFPPNTPHQTQRNQIPNVR